MSRLDDCTLADARSYGFGLLELYKLWHWNCCFPNGPSHDEIDKRIRETQRELDNRYQLLPLDADGEVIHIGDELAFDDHEITVVGIGWEHDRGEVFYMTEDGCDVCTASLCRHRKPTVEDVLLGFVIALDKRMHLSNGVATTIAEYAPKLQVKEDE